MTLHSARKQKTSTMMRRDTLVPLLELRLKLRQSGTSSSTEWGWAQGAAQGATLTHIPISSVGRGSVAGQFLKGRI